MLTVIDLATHIFYAISRRRTLPYVSYVGHRMSDSKVHIAGSRLRFSWTSFNDGRLKTKRSCDGTQVLHPVLILGWLASTLATQGSILATQL